MAGNTIRLHRVLRATPERVYRAFLDPDALAKWLPPNGFTGKVHQLDAKVGGTHRIAAQDQQVEQRHNDDAGDRQVERSEARLKPAAPAPASRRPLDACAGRGDAIKGNRWSAG